MTNIEKWPMAFENGIPKVGGRWQTPGYLGHATVGRTDGRKVIYEKPRGFDWAESFVDETGGFTFLGFADSVNQGAAAPQKPAPIVAPPPSLKAAVQQEGLSIPPQVGTRHEVWEEDAQTAEKQGRFAAAGASIKAAARILAADLAYDAEASAIRENRVIKKIALREMGRGDRECFKLRNLREFEVIKSAEHVLYFWWKP